MVRIVFNANKPMWVGLFVGIAGMLVIAAHILFLSDREWVFSTGLGVAIAGMMCYLFGRTLQIMKKRY